MKPVFISYTTADKEKATEIRNLLEQEGFGCWMGNRDIPGGSNYTKEITNAIRECQVFLLILSAASQKSKYVFRELDFAVKKNKPIIPYMIEAQELSDEFHFLLSADNGVLAYDNPEVCRKKLLEDISKLQTGNSNMRVDRTRSRKFKKPIVCPRCKVTRLKKSITLRDEWVENPEFAREMCFWAWLAFVLWIILPPLMGIHDPNWRNFIALGLPAMLVATVESIAEESRFFGYFGDGLYIIVTLVLSCLSMAVVPYVMWKIMYCVSERIRSYLHHSRFASEIDIQTYKCCGCNRRFRFKIPIKERDKYYIKELEENESLKILQKLIKSLTQ